MSIKSIAVFCGSKTGINPLFIEHAKQLGYLLAKKGITLIYGGGNKGIMGEIANAVLEKNGKVIGIIPKLLTEWEHQHQGISELYEVADMHTRKRMLYEKCDAAISNSTPQALQSFMAALPRDLAEVTKSLLSGQESEDWSFSLYRSMSFLSRVPSTKVNKRLISVMPNSKFPKSLAFFRKTMFLLWHPLHSVKKSLSPPTAPLQDSAKLRRAS